MTRLFRNNIPIPFTYVLTLTSLPNCKGQPITFWLHPLHWYVPGFACFDTWVVTWLKNESNWKKNGDANSIQICLLCNVIGYDNFPNIDVSRESYGNFPKSCFLVTLKRTNLYNLPHVQFFRSTSVIWT